MANSFVMEGWNLTIGNEQMEVRDVVMEYPITPAERRKMYRRASAARIKELNRIRPTPGPGVFGHGNG